MIQQYAPCIICRQKNRSDSLERLRTIRDYLNRNRYTKLDDSSFNINIAAAFMSSTHNHCSYGLSCSYLLNMTSQSNRIALDIEDSIIAFLQHVDRCKLDELLMFTRGYFPQAYIAIEQYWVKYHNM